MRVAGVFAPLPTPFDHHDAIDFARWRTALSHWVSGPLHGFIVLGTNGEAGLVDDNEADRLIDEARAAIPGERLLIVGTGRESTAATVKATQRAAARGADAVLVRTPSLFKAQMTGEAFIHHYTAVADRSPVPVLLYNFPASTGVNLAPQTVASLASHPNIAGIKESSSDLPQISDLVTMTPDDFSVLAGSAATFSAALGAGVSGGILALAALLPDACVDLFALMQAGRINDARDLQRRLLPIARLISTGGVPGLKAAFRLAGVDVGVPRRPLVPASPDAVATLEHALGAFKDSYEPIA